MPCEGLGKIVTADHTKIEQWLKTVNMNMVIEALLHHRELQGSRQFSEIKFYC